MCESSITDEFRQVKVSKVGFSDPTGSKGVVILESDDGKSFPMGSFSGEVAEYIGRFISGDRTSVPSIYKLISEFADRVNLFLKSVEVFEKKGVMRANIHFVRKEGDLSFENYRASDGIALATFYDAPIMVQTKLLQRLSDQE